MVGMVMVYHLCGLLSNGGWSLMAAIIEWLVMSVVDLRGMEAEVDDAAMFREIQKLYLLSVYTFPLTSHCLSNVPIHPPTSGISKRFAIAATLNSISVCISLTFAFIIWREGFTGSGDPIWESKSKAYAAVLRPRLLKSGLDEAIDGNNIRLPLCWRVQGYWREREGNIYPPTTLKTYINRLVMNWLSPGSRI